MALRTKNAIRRSFVELLAERPFDKISVRDIAERSEVTRNTFYYYYTDIYALTEDVFESEVEKLSESIDSYDSWQKAFLAATAFAAENKRMILHLHNSAHRDILARYFHKTILTGMLSYVQKEAEGLDVSERKIMALARFYTAALAGLTVEWLDSGMKGSRRYARRQHSPFARARLRQSRPLKPPQRFAPAGVTEIPIRFSAVSGRSADALLPFCPRAAGKLNALFTLPPCSYPVFSDRMVLYFHQ